MVRNVHERYARATVADVGALIDSLAGPQDRLWPHEHWPSMRLDRGLEVGADGGHGPVRYRVVEYEPGHRVRFRFLGPRGFDGYHEFSAAPLTDGSSLLSHELVMTPRGTARLTWPLTFRPLHDALIEESLDKAMRVLGRPPASPHRRSWWVRTLRRAATLRGPRRRNR